MLIHKINNALRSPVKLIKRYKAKRVINDLISHNHPKIKSIGHALNESINAEFSTEEEQWIDLIEKRRAFLLDQDRKVNVIDYGAGSGNTPRTKEQMDKRVRFERALSVLCSSSKSRFWALILFKLIRKLKPRNCLELGTCLGISAAYQCAALAINEKGKLVTLEGSPETARIADETFKSLGIDRASVVTGPFRDTFGGVLEKSEPIDFFFNDGHHDHDAVIAYMDQAYPHLAEDAIVVLDDISWSAGMKKAWKEISVDERVAAVIDLNIMGVVLLGSDPAGKARFSVPLVS